MASEMIERKSRTDLVLACIVCKDRSDLRLLPCVHTVCMTCLMANGGGKERMPCPECRIEFEIPRDGMEEMAVKDFIQKLWDIDRLSKTLRNSLCDFCSLSANQENPLGNPQGISKEIPLALVYCKECNQKLCEHCCEVHKRIKTTQNHTFLDFKDKSATEEYA